MTQLINARRGKITDEMRFVGKSEQIDVQDLRKKIADGKIVIPANIRHKIKKPCGIGEGLRTKVNANIGTSPDYVHLKVELAKLKVAVSVGADCVMDLSTGGDLDKIRKEILKKSDVPIGTVPIYNAVVEIIRREKVIFNMTSDDIFNAIEKHAIDGVDFITVHSGVTRETLKRLKNEGRLANIVSRGGAFLAEWMLYHNCENPLYEDFERILKIAKKFDVTLSLGDGLRPGSIIDATDRAQIQELLILGELRERALKEGVQVMIEGPGHVPLNEITANVLLEKKICHGAPFYVLGPLVTDVAPGYDHITAAIGGCVAASSGADFICYVTPSEHLGLPDIEGVREGVIAARIAGHAADISKGVKGAIEWDREMSKARKSLDWDKQIKLSIDPIRAKKYRKAKKLQNNDVCTMCGEYCAMKLIGKKLGGEDLKLKK
ncbi:MAG: phosphomethylpyrimidine synthase ThiC [Candidatus Firestonebacteria bacterium]